MDFKIFAINFAYHKVKVFAETQLNMRTIFKIKSSVSINAFNAIMTFKFKFFLFLNFLQSFKIPIFTLINKNCTAPKNNISTALINKNRSHLWQIPEKNWLNRWKN